jgi:hypothetical protein
MRVAASVWLLLSFADCAQAATPLRVAVLDDDLPGLEPSLVTHIGDALKHGGHTFATLNASQLADASVLARNRYDALILSHSPSFPGWASRNVETFLQAGGHLVLLGGFAYSRPVARVRGAWRDRAEFDRMLREISNKVPLFGSKAIVLSMWRRSTNRPDHPSRLIAGAGPTGPCFRLELRQLRAWQWDGYFTSLPQTVPAKHGLFYFQACGGPVTPQVAVEVDERDGSRWIAAVDLQPTWQPHVLDAGRFRFFKDGSPTNRGGPGDHLHLARAARLSFGLATGVTKHRDGDHLIEVAEIGTAINDLGAVGADYRTPNTVCFDDYEVYEIHDAIRAVAWPGQDLVSPDTAFEGPLTGLSAVGFTLWDRSGFLPLLAARDRYDRNRGWACAALVHYAGKYAGGCWLLSGITNPAFYRSAAFERCLTRFLAAVTERDLPGQSAAHNRLCQAVKVPLATSSPPGLKKSGNGRRFMTADGKPFFLIGADYIGSLDRKFFGGPWLWWLEADFRRARDAGLNSLRIYGAGAFWRDPQKLAALKECARKYRIYLLIVVVDYTDLKSREALVERATRCAEAFRDEPMLLGYDLQNEPYAYQLVEIRDGGETLGQRYPLWNRWAEYEQWAGLQMTDNFTSFPGLRSRLPRSPDWNPVLDATSGIFADWIRWQTEAIRAVDRIHPITVGFNTVFACLPGAASLDFVSYHAYQPPRDYENVLKNLTTLDRLHGVWFDRPITLGEFGYSNGLAMNDGWLDVHTSALGEFLHYLYAYAHGYDGCVKWALTDHPLELSRQQCSWIPADDLPQHIEQGRQGMFWSDGTTEARPKPLVHALRFFRGWLDSGGGRGELTVSRAPTRIGTAYRFQAERVRFVGDLRHAEPGFEFQSHQAANVLLCWDAKQARLVATADATVRLDLVRLCDWPPDAKVQITGMLAASRRDGNDLVLEVLEGEPVALVKR